MTAIADLPKLKRNSSSSVLGGLPQVNLLPPEYRAQRALAVLRRWLAVLLVVVLGLCVAVFAVAKLAEGAANNELDTAKARTTQLQAEERKYAEVPAVLTALANTKAARTLGMATDVSWSSYYAAITAVLPANVSLDSIAVTAATPMTAAIAPTNSLQTASVGQIQFTGRSTTVPNTAAWIDALNSVPGLANAWASTVSVSESSNHTVYYNVSMSVQVTAAAYTHRFDQGKEG